MRRGGVQKELDSDVISLVDILGYRLLRYAEVFVCAVCTFLATDRIS